MNPARLRATAARTLASLLNQKGSLASLLPRSSTEVGAPTDDAQLALLRELCFGTCRRYYQLDGALQQMLDKPLKNKDADIHCLLLTGLYQLQFLRLPDYAAINETVNACVVLKKPWAKGLVNGIMRQYQRQLANHVPAIAPDQQHAESIVYDHPDWLITALKSAWPEHWQRCLLAANNHPPMTLRVNTLKADRKSWLTMAAGQGIAATPGQFTDSAIYLDQPRPVHQLPGFADGLVSVQDEASQLIPQLLQLAPGHRVLDACAAPGGKTCHMLETEPQLSHVTALDVDARRLSRLTENLQRIGLQEAPVSLKAADGTQTASWWDGQQFDRILLDAPCSATGIIRRQPDIKLLRQSGDIDRLVALQAQLLDALWPCLAPGGILLYSTCSILPAENSDQICAFLQRTRNAEELPITADWGLNCAAGRQLLPQDGGPDGFYFAVIRKNAA